MEYILKTESLTKKYGNRAVVNNVNMTIKKGDIYGFIGKNGAGKTTLMRMVLSMANTTSGSFQLFEGLSPKEAGKKIGSLIEAPGLYQNKTAFENMKQFALLTDSTDSEINEILEYVGLANTGNKKVKNFSLGMRQRLGIAITMLGNPEFLVLDEPVNGLDPAGMKEVRELIIRLNQERGITVLISSHLLEELSKMATVYGIINNGVLVEEISADELEKKSQKKLLIEVNQIEKAIELLKQASISEADITSGEDTIILRNNIENSAQLNRLLVENGIEVSRLEIVNESLENYMVKKIGG